MPNSRAVFENPLMGKGSATSNNMKLVHWPLIGPAQAPLAVPNVTAHSLTVSVPITVLLHSGPLLCGFNVPIKGLKLTVIITDKNFSYR